MTIVIVKMSIPKVKIAVLKNMLIFDEKYLPQSVRLLEGGGGLKRYLAEYRLNIDFFYKGLPLHGRYDISTEGQYSGKMLAETGSFDILFGNWVLGIGFFHIYISI